ncbi:FxLYD domain-containing protein [Priestia aryabhattai]
MKKKMLIGTLAFGMLLAGCGKEQATDKTVNETSNGVHKTQEQAESQAQAQAEEAAKQNANIKLKTVEQTSHSFYDEIMEQNSVYYAAVIQNNSKEIVDVSSLSIAFLDKKGTVMGSASSSVFISPEVLEPGQKAYISTTSEISGKPENYGEAKLTVSPEITERRTKVLPISGVALDSDESNIFVKGMVKNTSKNPTDYITIAAALYSEDKKFVGVAYGQVQSTLNPNNSVAFTTVTPNLNGIDRPANYAMDAFMYEWPKETSGNDGDGEVTN